MFYKIRNIIVIGVAMLAALHIAAYSFAITKDEIKPNITKGDYDFARDIVNGANARLEKEQKNAKKFKEPQINQKTLNDAKSIVDGAYANLEKKQVSYTPQKSADGKAPIVNIDKMINDAPSLFEKSRNNDEMPNLLVFASLSMPKKSILQLSDQVNRAGGVLVLRGAHKGSLKATVAKLMALDKEGVSAVIDPKSFSNYQVSVVPTFVVRDRSTTGVTSFIDRMEGNVPLDYVLERFAREGQQSKIASELLDKMKRQI